MFIHPFIQFELCQEPLRNCQKLFALILMSQRNLGFKRLNLLLDMLDQVDLLLFQSIPKAGGKADQKAS